MTNCCNLIVRLNYTIIKPGFMRKNLPFTFFFLASLLLSFLCNGQQADRFAYAVSDLQQGTNNWSTLRKLNLQTGEFSPVLLNGNDVSFMAYDAVSKKQLSTPLTDTRYGQLANAAFGTGVAAVALDKKNNRLYYTPMFIDQLRYIDLKTMNVFYVTEQGFTGNPQKAADQANIVTRMAIASDGNGYAMTNDGNQLIQFTTGKKLKITDLGAIVDDPANKGVSIHNACSSYGGDMIADDEGNLYVITARNHVYKVNIETKVATLLGVINGLPANFTVNGAAVTDENKIVVGTATIASSFFTIDFKTLAATPYTINGTLWNIADLANSNLLATAPKNKNVVTDLLPGNTPDNPGDGKISIFPNPVTDKQFVMQFNQLDAGDYTIEVTDVMGRQVVQQVTNISGKNQTQSIKLGASAAQGVYMIKVTSNTNRSVYSAKIVVQ